MLRQWLRSGQAFQWPMRGEAVVDVVVQWSMRGQAVAKRLLLSGQAVVVDRWLSSVRAVAIKKWLSREHKLW